MPTVTVRDVSLHYTEQGEGPPVVFLHGTGASSFIWERSIPQLPPGRRLIAYDRRGFGASGGPLARRLRDHVDDAAALIDALDAAPAMIVTQSGGAPIALALTIAYPAAVSALVMAEPAYQVAMHPAPSLTSAMTKLLWRMLVRRDRAAAVVGYYRWASRFTTGGNAYDGYPERWQAIAMSHADATLREVIQLIPPWPRAAAVRRISCPTTLVIGDNGEPVFRRTTRRVHRLLAQSHLTDVNGASHLIPADQPELFAEAVAAAAGLGPPSGFDVATDG